MTEGSRKITYEIPYLADYNEKAIVAELQRVARLVSGEAFTEKTFVKHSRMNRDTVRDYFGSWFKALEAAGLQEMSSLVIKTRGGNAAGQMSNDDILDSLRRLAEKLGKAHITTRDIENNLSFSSGVIRTRWGSLKSALEAAGLALSPLGRRFTDDECFSNLLAVWTHYGRAPTYQEMCEPPSAAGGKAYVLRYGTWRKAVTAFVERANRDSEAEPVDAEKTDLGAELRIDTAVSVEVIGSEERRDIPLGLRFKVLHRDKFKCILCGDHPARSPTCVLHVDHILPWSLGGKTKLENLRALCETCNIGRGNRFVE
jgi:hypothetical protein